MKRMVATTLVTLAATAANAETVGRINDWQGGDADLMIAAGGPPVVMGSIAADGSVSLALPDGTEPNPLQQMGRMFGCNGEETVSLSNPELAYDITPVALMAGVMAERKRLGYVTVGSSPEKAKSLMDYASPSVPGSQYQWMHVAEAARVDGYCLSNWQESSDDPIVEMKTQYAMDLEPGWNLLEWEVEETFETSAGTVRARVTTIRSVDQLPEGAVWYFEAD